MLGSGSKDYDDNIINRIIKNENCVEYDSVYSSNNTNELSNIKLENDCDNILILNNFDDYNSIRNDSVDTYELFVQSEFNSKDESVASDTFQELKGDSESSDNDNIEEENVDQSNVRLLKIKSILDKELNEEMELAKRDLENIEDKIFQIRQFLIKIRHSVVSEYYEGKKPTVSTMKFQKPLHPAVKKILCGKEPSSVMVNNESNINNGTSRRSLRHKIESNRSKLRIKHVHDVNVMDVDEISNSAEKGEESSSSVYKLSNKQNESIELSSIRLPRYVPPKPYKIPVANVHEPRCNLKKEKIRLTVGNVSKWLGYNSSDRATHKWTVYIKSSLKELDLSKIIHKVKYLLHPSYKPNDVVKVSYPFKLARRGWGEFPLRISLEFINKNDKSVEVYHNLKLDRTHSGLETFGGETIIDVWVHLDENTRKVLASSDQQESREQFNINNGQSDAEINFVDCDQLNVDIENVDDFSFFTDRRVRYESIDSQLPSSSVSSPSVLDDVDYNSVDKVCEEVLIDFECARD